jgi:competence protein ComEC
VSGIEGVINEPQAGLGKGLLLGVKQALGEDLEAVFRKAGIIHIVVLSGFNIMIVVEFVMFMLAFFFKRKTRALVGLVAVACFALMVGLSATVVRASIMASLLLIAGALGRSYNTIRALLLAGAVMVFINPYLLLYDIGFQLSFMATLGLILIAPRFETLATEGFLKLGIKDYLFSTVATQIAVLPLLLFYMGEVSVVAILVNLLVLPIVPVAMLATFVSGVVMLVDPSIAVPSSYLTHLILSYIIVVATWLASLPLATVAVPEFSVVSVALSYLAMFGFLWWLSKERKGRDEYADWVIEEEGELKEKAGEQSSPAHTPIFFR